MSNVLTSQAEKLVRGDSGVNPSGGGHLRVCGSRRRRESGTRARGRAPRAGRTRPRLSRPSPPSERGRGYTADTGLPSAPLLGMRSLRKTRRGTRTRLHPPKVSPVIKMKFAEVNGTKPKSLRAGQEKPHRQQKSRARIFPYSTLEWFLWVF